jgi:translation initiation factor 1A
MRPLFVKLLSNRTLVIDTVDGDTVSNIKNRIYEREGISHDVQTLLFGNTILQDNMLISDYNIKADSTVTVLFDNLGGGRGGGKGGNHRGRQNGNNCKRELLTHIDGESYYGHVKALLGNKHATVLKLDDGKEYQCRIAGSLHAWVKRDDVVLIGLRDFEDGKADIVWRYTSDEARKLVKGGYITAGININDDSVSGIANNVDFVDDHGNRLNDGEELNAQNRNFDLPPSDSEEEMEMDEDDIDKL